MGFSLFIIIQFCYFCVRVCIISVNKDVSYWHVYCAVGSLVLNSGWWRSSRVYGCV